MKDLKEFLKKIVNEILNENKILNENNDLINNILDNINLHGINNISSDEKLYLKQYNQNSIDKNLEKWLLSDNEDTFDRRGNKLLYNEFEENEDIFYNSEKLIRIISNHLNKKPFTNNSDWGGALVWNVKSDNNYTGIFICLDDDELILLNRKLIEDNYIDKIIKNIETEKDLYKVILEVKKNDKKIY
jgi:hypothetical protein